MDRVSKHLKNVCESLGLNNIKTTVNIQDLPKIETQSNISINSYGHSDSNIYPIQTTQSKADKHVDLLVTSNSDTDHYIWIKNFNRLCNNVSVSLNIKQKNSFANIVSNISLVNLYNKNIRKTVCC